MSAERTNRYRIEPGWKPAFIAVGGYAFVVLGVWFVTESSASTVTDIEWFRALVFGQIAGAAFLVALVRWLNWDWVWHDPRKLEMNGLLWTVAVLMVIGALMRLDEVIWGSIDPNLVWWLIATCALVGFNEELLFRGIFLRSMRVRCRGEGRAALYTAAAFGLFHVLNVAIGEAGPGHVFLATVSGFGLYLWRRGFAWILPAMVVHGFWNFSVFAVRYDYAPSEVVMSNLALIVAVFASAIAAERIWKSEKWLVWQREGAGIDSDAPLVPIDPLEPVARPGG
jgi:hypothetical protein